MTAKRDYKPTTPQTADDETPRLSYLPSTYPNPVQVSTAQTPVQARVNTAAVNPASDPAASPVYCNQVIIAFPIGTDVNELFAASPPPTASVNTAKWSITSMVVKPARDLGVDADIDYATFIFDCANQSDFLINYDLVFGVAGQVSLLTGDSTVLIQEQSGTTNDPDSFTTKNCSYTVTAYTPQFYLQNFVATVPTAPTVPSSEFKNGAPIRLSWESNGTYFQVYEKDNPTPVYSGSQTTCTVAGGVATDTTFVLIAMMSGDPSGDGQQSGFSPIYLYEEFTVTVSNPDLKPKTAFVSGNATVGGTLGVPGQTNLGNATVGGTLGIGTAGPSSLLDVNGTAQLRGAPGGTGLSVTAGGNVGIGTTSPQTTLHVKGDAGLQVMRASNPDQTLTLTGGDGNGVASVLANYQLLLKAYGGGAGSPFAGFANIMFAVVDKLQMVINAQGVGIGTTTPTQAKLVVIGSVASSGAQGWTWGNTAGGWGGSASNLSILAGDSVGATNFRAFSDERIKNVGGRSDGAADLRTLLGIEVTDYRYKDVFAKGSAPHKKLIAQQVEKFFPQAVSRHTDVVPDIYRQAPVAGGWVTLATDLKKGERVRLIADKSEGVYEVLEVSEDEFRTDFKPEGDKVFVYGREVDDLRAIDYDAIAMLNVSATQQLKKEKDEEVEALRAESALLKAANDALLKRLQILESKMEAALNLATAKVAAVTA